MRFVRKFTSICFFPCSFPMKWEKKTSDGLSLRITRRHVLLGLNIYPAVSRIQAVTLWPVRCEKARLKVL